MQYRLVGAPAWTPLCVASTAPYSCALNTTVLTSGSSYEIQLIAADNTGKTTTTAPAAVTVDNVAPTAVDVQSVNGGTARVIDAGDVITFTWSEPMAPASILAGWGGGSQAIRVKVSDNGGNSLLELYDQTGTTRLNVTSAAGLLLGGDYVGTTPLWLNGTLAESGSTTTVTIGSLISGSVATVNPSATMVWASSAGATDIAGNPATGNTVTEGGALDRDF
jgi:chitinase